MIAPIGYPRKRRETVRASLRRRAAQASAGLSLDTLDDLRDDFRGIRFADDAGGLAPDVIVHRQCAPKLRESDRIRSAADRGVVFEHTLDYARIENPHVADRRETRDFACDVVEAPRPPAGTHIALSFGHG